MNERLNNNKIYLLAKEAGLIEFEKFDWNPELGSPTYESVAKARKFAELIVQDILTVVKSEHKLALEFQWDADDTANAIRDAVKKQFGVEE